MLKGTMNKLKLVAIAVISLVVLIVVLQNTQAVETNLLFHNASGRQKARKHSIRRIVPYDSRR
jgi:hypothetical protein